MTGIEAADLASVVLALGGALGSAMRVLMAPEHPTWSRRSAVEIIMGAASGALYPLYPVIALPAEASLLQRGILMMVIGYVSGNLIMMVAARLGLGPKNGTPKPPETPKS